MNLKMFIFCSADIIIFFTTNLSYPLINCRSCIETEMDSSLSGQNNLAMAREAGADIIVAVNKCVASTSNKGNRKKIKHSVDYYIKENPFTTCFSHPKGDKSSQNGTGDAGKPTSHHSMYLGDGEFTDVRLNQESSICLKDTQSCLLKSKDNYGATLVTVVWCYRIHFPRICFQLLPLTQLEMFPW